MSELVLSVKQISSYIKGIFDAEEMLIGVQVVGEITNLKPSGKAYYFDLKDDEASLPCVVFDSFLMDGFKFGDKVSVKGKLNYYTKGGRLSFVVSKIQKYGVGDLYKQYLELKDKLEKEGVFAIEQKQKLPKFPRRVGVVTSETGAVIRDIIRVARSKNRSTDIVLCPAKVQGVGAKESIIRGIEILDNYDVDVIIVARGGGSFEDYQPFNSEEVVMAVYNAKKPIISAIGHENDWSLIDFAADVRASTPSVASEIAFYADQDVMNELTRGLENALTSMKKDILNASQNIKANVNQIYLASKMIIDKGMNTHKNLATKLAPLGIKKIDEAASKLNLYALNIEKSNPMTLLKNGYAKISKGNKNISKIVDVKVGEEIVSSLVDGRVYSVVTKTEGR